MRKIINGHQPLNIDGTTDALRVLDYPHHEIHDGSAFVYCSATSLANSASIEIVISATTTVGKWAHLVDQIRATKETNVVFFESPTWTGGSLASTFNRNRNSIATPEVTMRTSPSITSDGTRMCTRHFGTGTRVGGIARGISEWDLGVGKSYLLRITSEEQANDVSWEIDWYEHTNI